MTSGDKNGVSIGESVSIFQTYYSDVTFSLKLHHFKFMLQTPFSWFNIYPQGMEKTVTYVKDRYNNTPMFITENGKQTIAINFFFVSNFMRVSDKSEHFIGYAQQDDPNFTFEDQVNDFKRIKYMENHIEALSIAIR